TTRRAAEQRNDPVRLPPAAEQVLRPRARLSPSASSGWREAARAGDCRSGVYQRQLPSAAIALAMSTGAASRPMLAYAVRQSGLSAFSSGIFSFDLDSTEGGDGIVKTPREPAPSLTTSRAAFLRAASRSMWGASPGGVAVSRRDLKISSPASGPLGGRGDSPGAEGSGDAGGAIA